MKTLGITGLIGSGKSEIGRVLEKQNICVIDADRFAHMVLLRGNAAYDDVVDEFGEGILGEDGEIVRKKLGAIVFAGDQKLEKLKQLTHPHINKAIRAAIAEARERVDLYKGILLDAIFLYENGLCELCDAWVFVDACEDLRLERVMRRDNSTKEAALSRIESQRTLKSPEKLAKCDVVIENNGTLAELQIKAEDLAKHGF